MIKYFFKVFVFLFKYLSMGTWKTVFKHYSMIIWNTRLFYNIKELFTTLYACMFRWIISIWLTIFFPFSLFFYFWRLLENLSSRTDTAIVMEYVVVVVVRLNVAVTASKPKRLSGKYTRFFFCRRHSILTAISFLTFKLLRFQSSGHRDFISTSEAVIVRNTR